MYIYIYTNRYTLCTYRYTYVYIYTHICITFHPLARYRTRPILLDSGPGAKLLSGKLSEAEYRGERAKVLRDSAAQRLGVR